MPWSARTCFGRKTFLLGLISIEFLSAALWLGHISPVLETVQRIPCWHESFHPCDWGGFLHTVLYWLWDGTSVSPSPGQALVCPVPLSLTEVPLWSTTALSLACCQMLAVMCFGSWTTGLFLAKYQILIKMPLTGITLGPGIHLKSLQQDTNSQSDFGIHITMEKFRQWWISDSAEWKLNSQQKGKAKRRTVPLEVTASGNSKRIIGQNSNVHCVNSNYGEKTLRCYRGWKW